MHRVDGSASPKHDHASTWLRLSLCAAPMRSGASSENARAGVRRASEKAAEYDEDGIDIYFLNSTKVGRKLKVNILFVAEPLHMLK